MRIVIHDLNIITQEDTKIQYGGTRRKKNSLCPAGLR